MRRAGDSSVDGFVDTEQTPESAVDAAMARVLQADAAAAVAVLAAREQAQRFEELSRQRARAVAERARSRVARAHRRVEAALQAALAAIAAEAQALGRHDAPDAADMAAVQRAVDQLAAELTGDTGGPPP